MSSQTDMWLMFLALPDATDRPAPAGLRPLSAADIGRLGEMARHHGVLPAVLANLEKLSSIAPFQTLLPPPESVPQWAGLKESLVKSAGFALMLRLRLPPIFQALQSRSIPAFVLRGPEFADRVYPAPGLRSFTDLDILVPRSSVSAAGEALAGLGYHRHDPKGLKHEEVYGEELWIHPDHRTLQVEIHWNLVNSPALQAGVSVELEDLQFEASPSGGQRLTAASLLLIAAVHGATSHSFDRLQILCDVRQIACGAAGPVDADYLTQVAARTGSTLSLVTALNLAERLYGDAPCRELRLKLAPPRGGWWSGVLMSPAAVVHSDSAMNRVRRRWFRELLKTK